MSVILETSVGDFVVDLFVDECPKTCLNFLKLCKIKYYNSCLFHRVEKDFIAQTGDPTGTGNGGDSVFAHCNGKQERFFHHEIHTKLKHAKKGTVSMASDGKDKNSSQFFITLSDRLTYLDEKHTVFGEVAEGIEFLDEFNKAFVDKSHRPLRNIRIRHTIVLDDPFPDPNNLQVPHQSPVPQSDRYDVDHVRDDEDVTGGADNKTQEELDEELAQKRELNSKELLTMLGDRPDMDAEAPDNALFVCKLNPATGSEDLELIFSRFGPIVKCEVIRDQKTGDSLQYAFIEFETPQICEAAYSKMENVLIDDRRIHVDFSQSFFGTHLQRTSKSNASVLKPQKKYEMVFDEVTTNRQNSVSSKSSSKRSRSPKSHYSSSVSRSHRQTHRSSREEQKRDDNRSHRRDGDSRRSRSGEERAPQRHRHRR